MSDWLRGVERSRYFRGFHRAAQTWQRQCRAASAAAATEQQWTCAATWPPAILQSYSPQWLHFLPIRPAPRNRDLRPTVRAGGSGPREQGSSAPPRTVPIYTTPVPLPSTFHTDPPTWKYFGLQTHTPLSTGCKADYWGSDERNLRVRSRVGDFILEESSFCFHPGQVTFSVWWFLVWW